MCFIKLLFFKLSISYIQNCQSLFLRKKFSYLLPLIFRCLLQSQSPNDGVPDASRLFSNHFVLTSIQSRLGDTSLSQLKFKNKAFSLKNEKIIPFPISSFPGKCSPGRRSNRHFVHGLERKPWKIQIKKKFQIIFLTFFYILAWILF